MLIYLYIIIIKFYKGFIIIMLLHNKNYKTKIFNYILKSIITPSLKAMYKAYYGDINYEYKCFLEGILDEKDCSLFSNGASIERLVSLKHNQPEQLVNQADLNFNVNNIIAGSAKSTIFIGKIKEISPCYIVVYKKETTMITKPYYEWQELFFSYTSETKTEEDKVTTATKFIFENNDQGTYIVGENCAQYNQDTHMIMVGWLRYNYCAYNAANAYKDTLNSAPVFAFRG